MICVRPAFLRLSIISIALYFLRLLRRMSCMALLITPPPKQSSPAPPPPPSHPWWFCRRPLPNDEKPNLSKKHIESSCKEQECNNLSHMGIHKFAKDNDFCPIKTPADEIIKPSRKRPARLAVPRGLDFIDKAKGMDYMKELEVIKGKDFFLARKKGRREVMEDRHAVVLDISGDPKQAFFVVIDGHGGHAAADYVAENLGKNIVNELEGVRKTGNQIEAALRGGYSATDRECLAQDVNGGACAAGVLLKDGELHAANVGDCKVVLSRRGKAITLTNNHRLSREDERARIENSGGFLYCHNGVWRVNGSLAVSRAFGDLHLKDWIICEPEIVRLPLTSECEFLIMASDGLWDKVSDQEAVDVVSREKNLLESCRKLVDISSSRGNRDDITVMMINLHNFKIDIPN
ncbi:Serine/threonine protein phosphatase [Handroanthus impetiginosus]|uniref:Serine/threonine protein phosphatase n=1 Tax=Handroanthus impetiginosus TaxID=429701 RepID=A0A2G9H289_9LAMI|nr:Serine/threonine protein phosphatase [Handroanthus impetiginosus]